MRKFWALVARLAAASSLLVAFAGVPAAASQEGPTLRVLAGLGQGVVSVNQYPGDPAFPDGNTVRVAVGTTVIWTLGSDEPHTVTFRAGAPWPPVIMPQPEDASRPPMYNPRLIAPTLPAGPWDGTTFIHMELRAPSDDLRVTFSRPGNYRYSCLFHEEMDGYVDVVPPGTAGITTQAAVDQFATTHLAEDHAEDAAQIMATRSRAERIEAPGDTTMWFVRAGTNDRRGHMDLNAFLPASLAVTAGDTVVWYVDHSVPHTVTFPAADGTRPELLALQLPDGGVVPAPAPGEQPPPAIGDTLRDPATAPRLVFVGGVATRPSPIYDGTSMYNSGIIGEHPLVTYPTDRNWALTFDAPGVYEYYCLLHEATGMKATITVQPRA